ncbi:CYFA0S01e15390g1_1 [Cyberlindnera fabianii]|uniref:CYFA0S01e15390g1_1 n=1 Tax=Cyberlindnera fabianii TaxID=36022 RepID=A0A061AKP0_CYBFA|nr:CYFA0S01e15390g1_1 [Cyberlindnera fabianii]
MTRESSLDYSCGLALTHSNSSSLRSYTSSLAESTATQKSVASKIRSALSRKRSKSLVSVSSVESQQVQAQASTTTPVTSNTTTSISSFKQKLTRNKSSSSSSVSPSCSGQTASSARPTSLITTSVSSSVSSTRDNSISSLSDSDLDFVTAPVSPLCRIEEDSAEKTGVFPAEPTSTLQSIRYNTPKKQNNNSFQKGSIEVSDKVLDDMADDILEQVVGNKQSIIQWSI